MTLATLPAPALRTRDGAVDPDAAQLGRMTAAEYEERERKSRARRATLAAGADDEA